MIPDIVPVNNWTGNNEVTKFEFDFLINSDTELKVLHTNKNLIQKELKLNIDYSINEIGNKNGSFINFPLSGSEYGLLQNNEKISILLNIPIAQTIQFGTSAVLNLNSLEFALDYIVRLIQIISREVERSVKIQEGSKEKPEDYFNYITSATVQVGEYANQAKGYADESETNKIETQSARNQSLAYLNEVRDITENFDADIEEIVGYVEQAKDVSIQQIENKTNSSINAVTGTGINIIYKSKEWATSDKEIEKGLYSSKYYAEEAKKNVPANYTPYPIGGIAQVVSGTSYTPFGFLPCDGAEYSKADFEQLWDNYFFKKVEEETYWNIKTINSEANWSGITYGNDLFVAVASGLNATSNDGINWTVSDFIGGWHDITFGNGLFIAVGEMGDISKPTDGFNWTRISSNNSYSFYRVNYCNNKFIAVGSRGSIATSTDGDTWNIISLGNMLWRGVTYGNGKFIAVGSSGNIATSTDGNTWDVISIEDTSFHEITYSNGLFVTVGVRKIATSTDGITWNIIYVGDYYYNGIAYGNGKFIAVGADYPTATLANIAISRDGFNWTFSPIGIGVLMDVIYGNGQFVVVNNNGIIASKIDNTEIKSILNTCTYSEYKADLATYGQCSKFAVKPLEYDGSNVIVIGSPTITADGVVSGFSSNDFISLRPNCLIVLSENKVYRFISKFEYKAGTTTQPLFWVYMNESKERSMYLSINANNGMTTALFDAGYTATQNIFNNEGVYKIEYETDFKSYYKVFVDGILYNKATISTSPNSGTITLSEITVGAAYDNANRNLGKAYLKQYSITVDGETVFDCVTGDTFRVPTLADTELGLKNFVVVSNGYADDCQSTCNTLLELEQYLKGV